jgi:hypothetical protein
VIAMAIFKILKALEFKLSQLNQNPPRFWFFKLIRQYRIRRVELRIAELKNELYIRKHETY